jgi:phosphopantothenoylcysteine decarboxylase/phosphopantothenate--cysteine ligase
MAMGLADDSLTTMVLATRAPIIICPAMDGHMYANIITQANIERLISIGHTIAGPNSGYLASGLDGDGRLLETNDIMNHIFKVLGRTGDLADKKVVVSAGGTREFIDPVRFIGNRSSGKMGYAIAEAARDRGAMTVLVAAPTNLPDPIGVQVLSASTALQMKDILATECGDADVLVMAAAVADWRPVKEHKQKLGKGCSDSWNLALTKTPDILADIQREGLIKVGFAAEDSDLENKARAKLEKKGLHLIAANDFTSEGAGFEVDTNRVLLLDYEGHIEELDLMSKYQVGHRIFDKVSTMFWQD